MREILAIEGMPILLGRRNENQALVVKFPIARWKETYGAGTFQVVNVRPDENIPYLCTISADSDFVNWTVLLADIAIAGEGKCQLTYTVGSVVAKSIAYKTVIDESLEISGTIPPAYESRINDLITAAEVAEEAATALGGAKSVELVNRLKDALDPTAVKSGYALLYSTGAELARSGFAISDYIPCFEGCKISKTWNLTSNTYGTVFYAADKETIVAKIPENLYSGDIIAPRGAYYFRTNLSQSYLSQIHIYVIPPWFNTVDDIDNYEVTKTGETINGFTYSAFPVITQFNGMEVIAFRTAPEHYTRGNEYGGTSFYVVNSDGTVEFKRFITDSEPEFTGKYTGEFRIEGLSVSPDGTKLFVSGFTSLDDLSGSANASYCNLIYELDSDFEIGAVNVLGQNVNYILTGKVLTTPSGYLVNAGHSLNQQRVVLFKSDQVYNNNLSQLTFTVSTVAQGTQVSESDLGFVNDKLACISRRHTDPSIITFASSKEGGGWGTSYELGSPLHMPKILECTHGNYLVYGGARYYSASSRKPVIGVYDVENHRVIQESIIWDGYECYGYYLDFVKVSDLIFDVVFYMDKLARNAYFSKIVYKRINIREVCPAVNQYV